MSLISGDQVRAFFAKHGLERISQDDLDVLTTALAVSELDLRMYAAPGRLEVGATEASLGPTRQVLDAHILELVSWLMEADFIRWTVAEMREGRMKVVWDAKTDTFEVRATSPQEARCMREMLAALRTKPHDESELP